MRKHSAQSVKASSTGTPPLSGAEAFARLLAAAVEKKPVLHVVENAPPKKQAKQQCK